MTIFKSRCGEDCRRGGLGV